MEDPVRAIAATFRFKVKTIVRAVDVQNGFTLTAGHYFRRV